MYTRELLLAAGILLLLFLGRREHLEFTSSIKDIRDTVDQAEQDRIFQMAPSTLQQAAIAENTRNGYPVDRSKTILAQIIRDFQREIYVPATAAITETIVNTFVSAKRATYQANSDLANAPFYVTAYSNGDAKRLLMTYLNLTPAGTIPPLSSTPTSSASIPRLLEQMRDNLLEYKMTGKSEYKSVYDGTKAWLDKYLSDLSTALEREADTITSDVNTYRASGTELTKAQNDFQTVKTEGPRLDDAYTTIKTQMDQAPVADTTGLYVKGGIALGLIVGAIALSLF